jgi:serine/threonine protein kinase
VSEVGAAEAAVSFEARRRLSGTTLGRYQVGPRIGAGGSAAVYLGRFSEGGELVALKVVHDHLSEENEFISQFLDEANLLVRLSHPNIVRVYELGRDGETLFLAMEYLHGLPLSKVVSALGRRSERLPPYLVAWVGARVAEGLAYAHALTDQNGRPLGVVHRDVSPQNVFLTYDAQVKLIDFGIARAEGRIAQTTLGRLKGKFSYMAPEQVLGREFDHRVDLFALGATLYEAAVGARLFAGVDQTETLQKLLFDEIPDPGERIPGFPKELTRILFKALANEPDERYATGADLARDLDAFLASSAGQWNGRHALAEVFATHFQTEREQQDRAIQELRSGSIGDARVSEPGIRESTSGTRSITPPRATLIVPLVLAGLLGLGAVVGGAAWYGARKRPAPPAPTVLAADVTLEISTQPDANARIEVDGVPVEGHPARVTKRRGDQPLSVVVQADGYEVARLNVKPDHDQSIVVPLTKAPEPVQSVEAPPSASAAGKSSVPRGGSHTKPHGKKKDPLVTKYPF